MAGLTPPTGLSPRTGPDPHTVLDHVTITAHDFGAGLAFYDAVLGALGLVRLGELGDEEEDDAPIEAAGWGAEQTDGDAQLWLVTGPVPTRGLHLRLRAVTREQVADFHRAALDSGGAEHSAPRRWTLYRRGEFNAIVRDPNGNLVEAVSPE